MTEAAGEPRLILYLWLANLLMGLALLAPLFTLLLADTMQSQMGARLLHEFPMAWVVEATRRHAALEPAAKVYAALLVAVHAVVGAFLGGGIIARLAAPDRASVRPFLEDCARHFARLLRLLLISAAVYGVIVIGGVRALDRVVEITTDEATTEWPVFIAGNLKWLAIGILVAGTNLVLDYARIGLVIGDDGKVAGALRAALVLVRRRFATASMVYLLMAALALLLVVAALELSRLVRDDAIVFIAVAFLMQQALIATRGWLQLSLTAAELALYRQAAARPVPGRRADPAPAPAGA
jgi:hypothetical protein